MRRSSAKVVKSEMKVGWQQRRSDAFSAEVMPRGRHAHVQQQRPAMQRGAAAAYRHADVPRGVPSGVHCGSTMRASAQQCEQQSAFAQRRRQRVTNSVASHHRPPCSSPPSIADVSSSPRQSVAPARHLPLQHAPFLVRPSTSLVAVCLCLFCARSSPTPRRLPYAPSIQVIIKQRHAHGAIHAAATPEFAASAPSMPSPPTMPAPRRRCQQAMVSCRCPRPAVLIRQRADRLMPHYSSGAKRTSAEPRGNALAADVTKSAGAAWRAMSHEP